MIRIALVEDHLMFRRAIKTNLDAIPGFTVVEEAACGLEFEKKYNPFKIDIVLMDLRLKGQHGYVTCMNLVKKHPLIKIIIMSMYDDPATIIRMIRCGAVGFLSKCDDLEEIEKTIREVMDKGFYYNRNIGSYIQHEIAKIYKKINYDDSMKVFFSALEIQIALHYCNQLTTQEIADALKRSPRTIESHKRAMVERTLSRTFMGVVVYMFRNQFLYSEDMQSEVTISSGQKRISG